LQTRVEDDTVDGPPMLPTADGEPTDPHARGDSLGRYVVLQRIGRGGMGVVYAAYDPELDRRVAVKLLTRADHEETSLGRSRLLREAQAMARVSHPNVVAVHDVGTVVDPVRGPVVFVAMELVVGRDLRAWLAERSRSASDVLAAFVQAGQGLLAAHRVGLIHRDFKPANVLVGDDGVVRVGDFGLARRLGAALEPSGDRSDRSPIVIDAITRTGAIIGTPAYMAPEQHLGRELDPRADQFGFCVALYEALYGERPFSAKHPVELMMQVTKGELAPTPRNSAVPGWIRRVIVRGLAPEPADRWPDMGTLVRALQRDPARTRRVVGVSAIGAGALATALWVVAAADEPDPCDAAEGEIAGVWGPEQRTAIQHSFAKSRAPYATDAAAYAIERLDLQARAWVDGWVDACAATHVRHEQSDDLLDRRMTCLGHRKVEMGALVETLASADDALVERSAQAVGGLEGVAQCADADALLAAIAPPADEAARAAVEATREELGRASALELAGRFGQGIEVARAALESAERTGWRPIEAEALLELAGLEADAGMPAEAMAHFHRAAEVALETGHDDVLVRAWIDLVWHVGMDQADPKQALRWAEYAEAALERVRRPAFLVGNLYAAEGAALWATGDYPASLEKLEQSLAIREEEDPNAPILANTHIQIGNALIGLGRYSDARTSLQRALAVALTVYGPSHPTTSAAENGLGVVEYHMGEFEAAEGHYQRAFEIMEGALGPESPNLLFSLGNLAEIMRERGKLDEALALQRRVLALVQANLPENHRDTGLTVHNIAETLAAKGDTAAALEHYRRALAIREKVHGPDDHYVANTLTGLGDALIAAGNADDAVPVLERALVIRDKQDYDPIASARTRIALAKALRTRPDGAARARELLDAAQRRLHDAPPALAARWQRELDAAIVASRR
jgi:eukaryotic-like serine/threonine-protein kinase